MKTQIITTENRVGVYPLVEPTSHTTVRTVRYTAVQNNEKGEINSHIACAYAHWILHRAIFSKLFTIRNSNSPSNYCIFDPLNIYEIKKPELMTARERIDEQAFKMAAIIMVPDKSLDDMLKPILKEHEKSKTSAISVISLIELLAKHYHTSKREIRRRLYETGFHSEKFKPFKQTELYNSITDEVNHAEKKLMKFTI